MNNNYKSFLNNVFDELSNRFNGNTKILIDDYQMQLQDENANLIPESYNINNIINVVTENYMDTHTQINEEDVKNELLKLIINIVLDYQYTLTSMDKKIDFNNFVLESDRPEDFVKMQFLADNQDIIGNLMFVGTSEMLYREIGEKLNLNIQPMYEAEYGYIVDTKNLLRDDKLLLTGNLNEIFNKLGNKYKERYLLNEVIFHMNIVSNDKLEKFTNEERQLLMSDLRILLPDIDIKRKKKNDNVKNLDEVKYTQKDGINYVKFHDNDNNLHFAEIVGNVSPQERIEKIKNGSTILSNKNTISTDDLSNGVKDDMIINGEFKNVDEVDTTNLDNETSVGINTIRKEGIEDMKFDTRTGMLVDENGKTYDIQANQNNKVEIQSLKGNTNSNIENINIKNDTKEDLETINQLEEYGIDKNTYLKANDDQKKQIRDLYGIGKFQEEKSNEKNMEKGNQYVKKFPSINGYVSSFIITFFIGALGGMIAMALLYLGR